MKKASIKDYELLIDYFGTVRTHCVSTKYGLLELSRTVMDDFTDCINADNRLVMTNFEIDQSSKRLEILKRVFDFTMFVHGFCEDEIKRFEKEINLLTARSDDDKIN